MTADTVIAKQFLAPGFPMEYSSTLFCEYSVVAPKQTRIRFWVNDFGTEKYENSRYYLWVSSTGHMSRDLLSYTNKVNNDL